jgi:transcriptional regulator with GAF, ATPase, and Fis domain
MPRSRWILSTCGIAILFYGFLVLGFVGTSPDLGLRFLLVDDHSGPGIEVQAVSPSLKHKGNLRPQAGDILLALGPTKLPQRRLQPVGTFMHFTRILFNLRGEAPFDGMLQAGSDPSELTELKVPPLVEIEAARWTDRQRWVEVELMRPGQPGTFTTYLLIHSLPVSEMGLSFIWLLLELGIFSVGALAFWSRPFDRPARLFFAMCIVSVGAFVGGYHWWVIASSLWLNIPFSICAVLVPVVTLHFFLIYPHPKPPIINRAGWKIAGLYVVPVLAIVGFTGLLCYSSWLYVSGAPDAQIRTMLELTRNAVYLYLLVAAGYFVMTLVALVYSFFTTRNPIEHSQVKWILWAGVFSMLPVGYTVYLAQFHRVEFAIGHGSLPMFTASLLFMLAYAVGIVRYKLMLIEQIFSREMLYFVVSLAVTGIYSLLIALGSLVGIYQNLRSSQQAALIVAAALMGVVILLGWLRDHLQRLVDRRFFREKYQLDKALQRMNQAVGHLVEPAVLAERLLASCRDVLLADRAALYLGEPKRQLLQLVAADPNSKFPLQLPADEALLSELAPASSLQRVSPGTTQAQLRLRELKAHLVHALEIDGEVAGVVLLGPKRNGEPYSAEDLTFLTALGQVTCLALQSAKVHMAVAHLNEELRLKVDKITEQQRQISMLQAEITRSQEAVPVREVASFHREMIKGDSPAIARVLETVRKVSDSQSSVLIRGESGTGKELLAQALHENSPRRGGPMIRVHCGALAPGILESELFGHVKGAFTSAHRDKIGRFEMAQGGTLFLDEIGDITLETQIKLLRVLQEREFEPVGGTRTIQVDVRLIAATHQNLEKLIAEGKFREDLFYRLNVISITLPALRERREDIFELALYFLTRAAQRVGKRLSHLDETALEALKRYHWPGNIRELENVIERAVVLSEQESITIQDLPPEILNGGARPVSVLEAKPLRRTRGVPGGSGPGSQLSEREQFVFALQQTGGNKAEAARLLGMPRSTFFSKLKKHALD